MNQAQLSGKRGSIFVLCMWVLLLLSIFSISVSYSVRQRIKVVERLETRQHLRRIAESGIQKAIYILKLDDNGYDGWSEGWYQNEDEFKDIAINGGRFSIFQKSSGVIRYGITDEESKININLVGSPVVFRRLFHDGLGLDETISNQLAESILDWRDEDDNPRGAGAESAYYQTLNPPYRAMNSDFASLDELLFIKGVDQGVFSLIAPYLSVDSTGKINLNTASTPVLRAMGFSESLAGKLVMFRSGLDQILGTKDDNALQDSQDIVAAIDQFASLTGDEKNSLKDFIESGLFTIKSSYFQIQANARLGNRGSELSVVSVAEKNDSTINIIAWRESFYVE